AVPPGSLDFWSQRLRKHRAAVGEPETRFGRTVLPLRDPHGLRVALVESEDSLGRPFASWKGSPIPEEHQIRGLESARWLNAISSVQLRFWPTRWDSNMWRPKTAGSV